jgi:hypothetical protein
MKISETFIKLNTALLESQKQFTPVKKAADGQDGNRKFKYATLDDILAMAVPILNAHGILLSQYTSIVGQDTRVVTRLDHVESGEWKESDGLPLRFEVLPKELGGEVTYWRRYDISPFLGIATEEDTDAPKGNFNAAKNPDQAKAQIDAARARTNTRPAEVHEAKFRLIGDRLTVPVEAVEKKHSDKKKSDYLVVWPDGTVNGTDRLYVWDSKLFPHLVGKAQKQTCSFNIEQKKFTTTNGKEINSIIITGVDTVGEDVIEQTNCAPATEDYADSDIPF